MENGGDKDGKAIYRFADTGIRTDRITHTLISDETIMKDLYGNKWAHTKKGWVKADDKITWYDSYTEATHALAKKKTWRRTLIRVLPFVILAALVAYLIYKHCKNTASTLQIDTTIETPIEPIIPDEIPMD